MNWQDILSAFEKPLCGYPVAAAQAALNDQAFYERMVLEFDRISTQPNEMVESMFHIHAMHLLAEKREHRAFAPLMRIAALPDEQLDEVLGDFLTESFKNCVAATCKGEEDELQIRAFIETHHYAEYARYVLVDALTLRVIAGDSPAEPLLEWLQACGERTLTWLAQQPASVNTSGGELLMNGFAGAIADIGSTEHIALLQTWSDKGLLDRHIAGMDWYTKELKLSREERKEKFYRYKTPYIVDAIAKMSKWHCFSEEFHHPRPRKQINSADTNAQVPQVRQQAKTGRNDPCPCGSGKKYKKCCGG